MYTRLGEGELRMTEVRRVPVTCSCPAAVERSSPDRQSLHQISVPTVLLQGHFTESRIIRHDLQEN